MDSDDDVLHTHPTATRRQFMSFSIDDAFNDVDDDSVTFQFSPDVIREDMARRLSEAEDMNNGEKAGNMNGFSGRPDASVSILDMNGDQGDMSPEPSSPGSLSPSDLSPKFVAISLSRSTSGQIDEQDADSHSDIDEEPSNHDAQSRGDYPTVHIDTAQLPEHRVTLSTDSQTTSERSAQSSSPRPSTDDPTPASHSIPITTTNGLAPPTSPTHADTDNASAVASTSAETSALPLPTVKHRATRSGGPSMFEQVISKTRPTFLPPKPKQEDNKHLADWQAMMKQSRLAAERRRKALQERRLAREKKIDESLHIWERDIVPDWRVVYKNPDLRKLWWQGIPTKLRASMWERAIGNPLALSKDSYRTCLSRAKRALAAGTFPSATLELIEQDAATTLPSLNLFHPERGPLYADLKDMLYAWVVSRSDEGLGYTLGAAKIAAMLLINLNTPQAFMLMRNLLERHCLRSFFGGDAAKPDVEAYYRIFDTLLADGMPKIYFNFKQHHISPASYLPDWLVPLFLDHLPFDACARVWDVIILEGDSFIYRAALGILAVLEPRLFFPDKRELLDLLKGDNKAAIDVAVREGQRLDGGKYEIYGVDEETLWDRINDMQGWWKESTWTRLIQRELPDL